MNCNELLKEIQKRLVESGISDMITEYVREHPEYWVRNNTSGTGYNTSCQINICFNTASDINMNDMTQATPFYMLSIGRNQNKNVDVSVHPKDNNAVWTDYWYNGSIQLSHRGHLNG